MSKKPLGVEPQEDAELDDNELEVDMQAWEREYVDERSWEAIQEDEHGQIKPLDTAQEQREKRQRQAESSGARIRRGMIRYLYLILDFSRAAGEVDMRPSRMAVTAIAAELFVREFFDQNPLSQLSMGILRDGVAKLLTPLSGSPEAHIKALKANLSSYGDASLQNGLEMALEGLRETPSHGHREILILFSSLSTCDPGDITASLAACQNASVRCSVVGLAAEVFICRQLATKTGGEYAVALNESHLQELVLAQAPPPPTTSHSKTHLNSMVRMGFPMRFSDDSAAICACHLALKPGPLFMCPRCKSCVCELPSTCPTCALPLVSSPHLARSYHHLFPVPLFHELPKATPNGPPSLPLSPHCFGCFQPWTQAESLRLVCGQCERQFCFQCDCYIHESLHNCPGCLSASTATSSST